METITLSGRLTNRRRARWLNEHAKSGHSRGISLEVDTCRVCIFALKGVGVSPWLLCVLAQGLRMATVLSLIRGCVLIVTPRWSRQSTATTPILSVSRTESSSLVLIRRRGHVTHTRRDIVDKKYRPRLIRTREADHASSSRPFAR